MLRHVERRRISAELDQKMVLFLYERYSFPNFSSSSFSSQYFHRSISETQINAESRVKMLPKASGKPTYTSISPRYIGCLILE